MHGASGAGAHVRSRAEEQSVILTNARSLSPSLRAEGEAIPQSGAASGLLCRLRAKVGQRLSSAWLKEHPGGTEV